MDATGSRLGSHTVVRKFEERYNPAGDFCGEVTDLDIGLHRPLDVRLAGNLSSIYGVLLRNNPWYFTANSLTSRHGLVLENEMLAEIVPSGF